MLQGREQVKRKTKLLELERGMNFIIMHKMNKLLPVKSIKRWLM